MIDVRRYQHAEKRKWIAQALTDHSLDMMESEILEHTGTFCSQLVDPGKKSSSDRTTRDWSSARNVQHLVRELTFDVMGDICFGYSFQMLVDNANHGMLEAMKDGGRYLYAVSAFILSNPSMGLTFITDRAYVTAHQKPDLQMAFSLAKQRCRPFCELCQDALCSPVSQWQ